MNRISNSISILFFVLVSIVFIACSGVGPDLPDNNDPVDSNPTLSEYLAEMDGTWYDAPNSWNMGEGMYMIDVDVAGSTVSYEVYEGEYQFSYDWSYDGSFENLQVSSFSYDETSNVVTFTAEYYIVIFDRTNNVFTLNAYAEPENVTLVGSSTATRTLGNPEYEFAYDIYEIFSNTPWFSVSPHDASGESFYLFYPEEVDGNEFTMTAGNGSNNDSDADGVNDYTYWNVWDFSYEVTVLGTHNGDNSVYETHWVGGIDDFYALMTFDSFNHWSFIIYADDTYADETSGAFENYSDYADAGVIDVDDLAAVLGNEPAMAAGARSAMVATPSPARVSEGSILK